MRPRIGAVLYQMDKFGKKQCLEWQTISKALSSTLSANEGHQQLMEMTVKSVEGMRTEDAFSALCELLEKR